MAEILKLTGTKEWLGTHMDLTLEKPSTELLLIIERLLAGKLSRKGRCLNIFQLTLLKLWNLHHILYLSKVMFLFLLC